MRCDQHMGLPPEAEKFLKENEIAPPSCACCNRPFPKTLEKIGEFVGMFETEYPLHRRHLKDGRYADEFLQAAPWSSGPCHFLGLKVIDQLNGPSVDQVFEWPQFDIDNP